MSALFLTPERVNNALNLTSFIKSNGYLVDYRLLYLTVTDASAHSFEQLKNIVVSNSGKRVIQLRDIADFQAKEAVEYIKVNANGQESILIAIIKQPNVNLIDVSKSVKLKVADLGKVLPKDVTVKPYYNQADFVNLSVKSVEDNLLYWPDNDCRNYWREFHIHFSSIQTKPTPAVGRRLYCVCYFHNVQNL